ncbi:MAG: hypothetical protein UX19_C0002G0057 [Candidatus Woesebacteria bacterium GW2011_GWA1_45_8]|uniref:Uncharacterized protein n=1 Tax=Candidatus Woesebacteria bacterium GW2011_GWA1_45_8 TaxID=1618559 RepID=A0A0G1QUL7_9BACT|nr:MAG: hypothetical protein UX19_C0002G0057 [Candidatus Woesebacteria bacterium GW2011_GWA1_45_8]
MDKTQTKTTKAAASAPAQVRGQAPAKAVHLKKQEEVSEEVSLVEGEGKVNILKPGVLMKAAALAVINLIVVAGVVFLMGKIQTKAQAVKRLRSIQVGVVRGDAFSALKTDVEEAEAKTKQIIEYYPGSQGLIDFVGEIDKLKAEGLVTGFSFANEEPIKDRTGSLGLPVLIEIKGNWSQIDSALSRVMGLPYLLRPIRVDAQPQEEEPGLIQFKFGGFLYVDKNFSQN